MLLMFRKALLLSSALLCVVALAAQQIRLATYQYADNDRISNIQPLADHLHAVYGFAVEVKSYPTVHAFIKAIQQHEVDIALINTFGYLLLETYPEGYPMQPLFALSVAKDAKDNYKTALLASSTSPIHTLQDVKTYAAASRFMLVAEGSTSGNLVPRLALTGLGITDAEKSFKSVTYGKIHSLTADAVVNGATDLAAMGSTEYYRLLKNDSVKNKFRLLWLSPEIPLGPVLINKKLPQSVTKQVGDALLSLHTQNLAALAAVKAGWSEAKQATHYIAIDAAYYHPFIQQLGDHKSWQKILQQFAY
jgi:phosphonate transport system substrate-binding protein